MMNLLRTLACGTLALLLPAAAEVSALHPRIYVRNDSARTGKGLTVSELRSRLSDPQYARWRNRAPGRGAAAMVERAARYLEDGNAADLDAVRQFLLSNTFSYQKNDVGGFLAGAEMAIAFDWIHAGLSPADRAAALANIVTTTDSSRSFLMSGGPDINHNYTYMALNSVAVSGLVLHGEPEPYHAKALEYLDLARRFLEAPGKVLDTWNARQGAWAEGSHYTFHETLRTLVLTLAAYRTAGDTDHFARVQRDYGDFLAKAGRFLVASTRPDMTFERVGDTSANRAAAALTVPLTVEMLAEGLTDAAEQARLRSFSQALLEAYAERAVYPSYHWGMRIFYDPRASRTPSYTSLPLAMRLGAGTYEHIMLRNGWTPDSTLITILAGDHFTDHQHFDKGQFLIYHRGGLAVDSGAYDRMYQADRHSNEYAPRTLAHNCILVYDPDQAWPKGYTNDGGQNVIRGRQHHGDWPTYLAHRDKEGLHAAEVLASDFDDRNQHDYLRVNLTKAYSEKVTYYDRQFVYLPAPDVLIVFDRVSAAQPGFSKRWLLHFQDRPLVDGNAPEPGVKAWPGAGLTSLEPLGRLFVRTLLPAERTITTVGGPGFEFFNAFTGKNYPVSDPRVAADPRESGNWRIEVAPARAAKDDQFLHVIQMAPTQAVLIRDQDNKMAGARILNQVVLFAGAQSGGPVALPLRYQISSTAPADHLLTELPPLQDVVIQANGKTLARQKVNAQGVLSFRDPGKGTRRILIRQDGAPGISEDFSRGLDNWWVEGGERVWIQDGRLRVDADNPNTPGGGVATVWSKTPHPASFRLELDAQVLSSSLDANNINLFFNYADPAGGPLFETRHLRRTADYNLYHGMDGYIVTFLNEAGKARIRIRRNPGFRLLAEKYQGACRQGVTYHLTLTKQRGQIRFSVNGQEVLTATDPMPLGAGLFALRTYRTRLWWDNVRLTPLE